MNEAAEIEKIAGHAIPGILIVGAMILGSHYVGKLTRYLRLPSIIGFMVVGVALGPSCMDLLHESAQHSLEFITEIALGFVAISIGLELSLRSLRSQGNGIISIIFAESLLAFIVVTLGVWGLTGNLAMALLFGGIAPASAPAGTVAVINEYKARGPLTQALYAVVGFDDGLGIIIFGFSSAMAYSLMQRQLGGEAGGMLALLSGPLKELGLCVLVGVLSALVLCLMIRFSRDGASVLIPVFGMVLVVVGLCRMLHLSLILTNMILGLLVVNTQPRAMIDRIQRELSGLLPLLFVMFFTLAGAHLDIRVLPALGWLGVVYALCRTTGLIGGARIGAMFGHLNENIQKYLGLGILSQAGVAIGLALVVRQDFMVLGKTGEEIGVTVITTVTATCIFFELIGPILTKIALTKAGEIRAG